MYSLFIYASKVRFMGLNCKNSFQEVKKKKDKEFMKHLHHSELF